MKYLLKSLWEKAEKLNKPELDNLKEFCEDEGITNIEDLLTSAYIADFCTKNPNVLNLLGQFVYTEDSDIEDYETREKEIVSSFRDILNNLFSLLCGTMIKAKPNSIHSSIANFNNFKKAIITTNYDICMDTAIQNSGNNLTYEIEQKITNKTSLIKIHGSINWLYCNTCQNIKILKIDEMDQIIKGFQVYPVTGMCHECNALTNILLVPPTSFKYINYPTLIPLWNSAQDKFNRAKLIIFVGYSFSDSDDYITKMLTNTLRSNQKVYLMIINKSRETIQKLKNIIKLHIENYNQDEQLIPIIGDANKLLPKILQEVK